MLFKSQVTICALLIARISGCHIDNAVQTDGGYSHAIFKKKEGNLHLMQTLFPIYLQKLQSLVFFCVVSIEV